MTDPRNFFQNRVRAVHILHVLAQERAEATTTELQEILRDHQICDVPGCDSVQWRFVSQQGIYASLRRLESLGCVTRMRASLLPHTWRRTQIEYIEPLIRPIGWDADRLRQSLQTIRDRLDAAARTG